MRCFAVTKERKRCSRRCRFIFCHQHQVPGYILLLLVTNFLSALGGLFADFLVPISQALTSWPPDHVAEVEASLQVHKHLPTLETLTSLAPPIPEISAEARAHAAHLPEDAPPYVLGLKYLALGNYELADTHLARAESAIMEQFGAIKVARARTRAYSGRISEAVIFYQEAMAAQPNNAPLKREASFGLFMGGHYQPAIDTLAGTLGNLPSGEAPQPTDLCSPLLLLSTYKMQVGDYSSASVILKKCEDAVRSDSPPVPRRLKRELAYYRALLSASRGQYLAAIQEFRSSLLGLPASPTDPLTAATYRALGTTYHLAGKYKEARQAYASARSILEQMRPVPAEQLGDVFLGSASSYYMQDRYNIAQQELRRAVELLEGVLPPEHPGLFDAKSLKARLLTANGDHKAALLAYESLLNEKSATLSKSHPSYLVTLANRGFLYTVTHQYDLALSDYGEAISGLEKAIGPSHPFIFSIRASLGLTYSLAGKPERAMEVFASNLAETCVSQVAINQITCANTRNSLAGILAGKGNVEGAIKQYEMARVLYKRLLPQPNIRIANNYNDQGFLLLNSGKARQAEELLRRAVDIYKLLLPNDHSFYATGLVNLASARESLAFLGDAEKMYRQVVVTQAKKEGGASYRVRRIKGNLANNLNMQGRFSEACGILKTLVSQSSLDADPPDHSGIIRINLGRCLAEQGNFGEAEKHTTEAQEFLIGKLREDHPLVAVAYHGRARVALLEGDLRKSKSFLDRADRIVKPTPSNSRLRVSILITKGDLSFEKKDLPAANRGHAEAFETAQEHLGREHYLTIVAARQYAMTLRAQGFTQRALELEKVMNVARLPK